MNHKKMNNKDLTCSNKQKKTSAVYEVSIPFTYIPELPTQHDKFFNKVSLDDAIETSWQRPWEENFEGYSKKYASAAAALYETAKQNTTMLDIVTYPIMFLARHSIELSLKSIICKLGGKNESRGHNLECLWEKIDKLYSGDRTSEQYKSAKCIIKELSDYDKQSDTFRYHIHNDASSTAQDNFLDIDNFYATFAKLKNFLEGVEIEIDLMIENLSNP